jgi:hypothetical protein
VAQWPGEAVIVSPGYGLPLVDGRSIAYGASLIGSVCSLARVAWPAALVAVTTTRRRRCASLLVVT